MPFVVYMLRTSRDTLYTGQTNDLEKRLREHNQKKSRSSKYMRTVDSFTLVYSQSVATRSEALKREWEIKQLSRKEKDRLINSTGNQGV